MAKTKKHPATKPTAKKSRAYDEKADSVSTSKRNIFKVLKHFALIVIIALTALAYSGTLRNSLTYWDDDKNVSVNNDIRGFSAGNLKSVFTKSYLGMYVPLTMVSYMADHAAAGFNPKMYHLTNLLLHILTIILVYLLIMALLNNVYAAGIAGGLFALHPLNVEAVAWISARSTLLYALFFVAALLFYVMYLKNNLRLKYLVLSLVFFVLSALSKSQAMTLPLILFVLDYYLKRTFNTRAWVEKIPFLLIAAITLVTTFYFRKDLGTQNSTFTFFDNIIFSFYSVAFYFVKFFAPVHLSAYIPFPVKEGGMLPLICYLSPLLVMGLVALIILSPRYRRIIITGLLLFVLPNIMLMIKTVSVGQQIAAERYAYIPAIGLAFLIAALVKPMTETKKKYRGALQVIIVGFFAGVMILFSFTTYARVKVWKNDMTLWNDVIAKEPFLYYGYYGRANAEVNNKMFQQAIEDYNKAIMLNPAFRDSYLNRANVHYGLKNFEAALADATQTILLDSNSASAWYLKGLANLNLKKYPEALKDLNKAASLGTVTADGWFGCALASEELQDTSAAINYYSKGIELAPSLPGAYLKRGRLKGISGDYAGSIADFDKSIELAPNSAESYANRGNAKFFGNDKKGACADWNKALEMGLKSVQATIEANCK